MTPLVAHRSAKPRAEQRDPSPIGVETPRRFASRASRRGDEHVEAYGFVNCVVSLKDLSSSIWTWFRDGDKWAIRKTITIPAEPADADDLPPILKAFKATPPFVTDIDLSIDDKFLYVACCGTGDLPQYDVSDPFQPKLTGKVRVGGVVSRADHPSARNGGLNGGPQMVEVSRDGRRVYFTNSLYGAVDAQLYPDGMSPPPCSAAN